jgi:hypothetical protein
MILKLVEKTKQLYVLPTLPKCNFLTASLDLWISKGAHHICALVISFLGVDSNLKHVTFDIFEVAHVSKKTWTKNLIEKNIT